jgi:hypothetical protein
MGVEATLHPEEQIVVQANERTLQDRIGVDEVLRIVISQIAKLK